MSAIIPFCSEIIGKATPFFFWISSIYLHYYHAESKDNHNLLLKEYTHIIINTFFKQKNGIIPLILFF